MTYVAVLNPTDCDASLFVHLESNPAVEAMSLVRGTETTSPILTNKDSNHIAAIVNFRSTPCDFKFTLHKNVIHNIENGQPTTATLPNEMYFYEFTTNHEKSTGMAIEGSGDYRFTVSTDIDARNFFTVARNESYFEPKLDIAKGSVHWMVFETFDAAPFDITLFTVA
jgi:hypothetical protein